MKPTRHVRTLRFWFVVALLPITACTCQSTEKLPNYGALPDFHLVDQNGHAFGLNQLKGHPTVVDFVFTRCPTVCPKLTTRMVSLQRKLHTNPDVRFVSISVDPAFDTPERLKAYAAKFKADTRTWTWLTGENQAILSIVRGGFKQAVDLSNKPEDVVHSTRFVLIDRDATIRGFYSSAETDEVNQLIKHAEQLSKRH